MRKAGIVWIVLVALLVIYQACSSQKRVAKQPSAYNWFSFQWYADSVSGRYYDKLALMLPIEVNNLKGKFIAQFDLGSNASELYGNPLKNYFESRSSLLALLDTTQKIGSGNQLSYRNKGFIIKAGNYSIRDWWFKDNYGTEIKKDSLFTSSDKLVATIGADFTKDKVLIIDYPNERMCLLDSLDGYWTGKATFVDCTVQRNRIHIPLTVNGKEYQLLFDTGASLFPIMTDYDTWVSLADPAGGVDTLTGRSWGEMVDFIGADLKYDTYLGKQKLAKGKVYYNTNKRLQEFNKQENISGTTGNMYFLTNTVVIDFKNKRFGVVK